jgi:nicotinate phosphoribosyltransferase
MEEIYMSIITSLLDNDFYKFTMMQCVLHQFPGTTVKYEFKSRGFEKLGFLAEEVNDEIGEYCILRFYHDELEFLRTVPYFTQDFIDFLSFYRPNRSHIKCFSRNEDLVIEVTGSWLLTILFEVPILAIVNELYFQHMQTMTQIMVFDTQQEEVLQNKLSIAQKSGFTFSDFGTRRRFSNEWQYEIVKRCSMTGSFNGTSNVLFSKYFNMKPIGTMAHEFLQAGQAVGPRIVDSQKYMLQKWVDEYRGNLGIALTDVISIDAFLRDFDSYFAKLYDGVRHDSGDPFDFGYKVINHYQKLRINPRTKTLVFSDGLNFEKAAEIYVEFKNNINVVFGIGTNLTNDVQDFKPLNIVMKMTECNGSPVAKISDSPGKSMCRDEEYVRYVKKVFQVKDNA